MTCHVLISPAEDVVNRNKYPGKSFQPNPEGGLGHRFDQIMLLLLLLILLLLLK